MIAAFHRSHRRGSLNYVYRHGKTARSEFLSLRYADSRKSDYRLAVVVSKKVSKSAVVRNRIRRRIYEIIRLHKKETGKKWPVDMVVSVFDDRLAGMEYGELRSAVEGLLKKAGL